MKNLGNDKLGESGYESLRMEMRKPPMPAEIDV